MGRTVGAQPATTSSRSALTMMNTLMAKAPSVISTPSIAAK